MQVQKSLRQQTVILLALSQGVNNESFFAFCGDDLEPYAKKIRTRHEKSGQERDEFVIEALRSTRSSESFCLLADIHPAWIVQALSKESIRIIGIILRYLPSKHVRYVIDHLPKRTKERLPHMMDAFAVQPAILEIIKNRFMRHFLPMANAEELNEFSFEHADCLKSDDLYVLFHDLGIHEMAMALSGMEHGALKSLFNRLNVVEARALEQRLHGVEKISSQLMKEAKYNLLEMPLGEYESKELLKEIGISAFCWALMPDAGELVSKLRQKLDPTTGHLIQRYFNLRSHSNPIENAHERRAVILARIYTLSKGGLISDMWAKQFAPADEMEIENESNSNSGVTDEDMVGSQL